MAWIGMPVVRVAVMAALAVAAASSTPAQTPAGALTIGEAIAAAAREHPGPAEAAAQAVAAAEAVNLSRAAYLPRLDAMWQLTRASRNNVFGAFFPQNVVPISGPVLGTESFESAWGTATGLLFSAEVFDFGRRAAGVREARAGQQAAEAHADAIRLAASVRAADLFLAVLGATTVIAADTTTVDRLEQLHRAVGGLVDAQVRPEADRARVEADLGSARGRLFADEQLLEVTRIRLAVAIGQTGPARPLEAATLLTGSPGDLPDLDATASAALPDVAQHPAVREAAARGEASRTARDATRLAYRPTVLIQGALSARASGALLDGTIDNSKGLWPEVPNWAAGVSVTFPLLDFGATRARSGQRTALAVAADARRRAVADEATGAIAEARAMALSARRIAGTVPMRLDAARASAAQARARYEAGLTGITEVVDAERVLALADADAALATLALWRARLAQAAAAGDLAPFLAEVAAPSGPPVPR